MKSAELKVLSAELKDRPHFDKLSASQGAGHLPSTKVLSTLFLTQHSALSTQHSVRYVMDK